MTDTSSPKFPSESDNKKLAAEDRKVTIWNAPSYPFVSLYEIVKQIDSHKLFRVGQSLEDIVHNCADNQQMGHKNVHDINRVIILSHLDNVLELITELPLEASIKQIERIKKVLSWPNPTYDHVMHLTLDLQGRIHDELSSVLFMHFTLSEASRYQDLNPFGPEVAANFHSTAFDIEEAAKCLATTRYTACVFHLMRVLEVALKVIAKSLGIPDPVKEAERNWGGILRKINEAMGQKDKLNDPAWLEDKDFYKNAYTDLTAVRTAWRNPTMHIESRYDDQRASHIYNVVKGFMQHLAIKLQE